MKVLPRQLEICFTPALWHLYESPAKIAVVVDIFRATTAICTAFDYGVSKIIPVASMEEARSFKYKGYLIAAERDGVKLDFADFGNSPFNFMQPDVKGSTIVYSTTNGTQAIKAASGSSYVLIASFINLSAVVQALQMLQQDVVILCAGWKERFSLEDAVFAGALAHQLIDQELFVSECDSVTAALELWQAARPDLMNYRTKFAHSHRLKNLMLDDVIAYCLTPDQTTMVPVYRDGVITPL